MELKKAAQNYQKSLQNNITKHFKEKNMLKHTLKKKIKEKKTTENQSAVISEKENASDRFLFSR